MAFSESVSCDICGRVKGETNHWLIATSTEGRPDRVGFWSFNDRRDAEAAGLLIEDICGADCAHKRLQRALNHVNALDTKPEEVA